LTELWPWVLSVASLFGPSCIVLKMPLIFYVLNADSGRGRWINHAATHTDRYSTTKQMLTGILTISPVPVQPWSKWSRCQSVAECRVHGPWSQVFLHHKNNNYDYHGLQYNRLQLGLLEYAYTRRQSTRELQKTKAKLLETPITTSSQHGPGSGLITTPNSATTTTTTTARSQKKATTFLFLLITVSRINWF